MNTNLKIKIGLLFTLILFSAMTIVPSFYEDSPDWWRKYLAPQGLKLGLDLQGGVHMVLRVDLDKAVSNSLGLSAQDLKKGLAKKNISVVQLDSPDPAQVIFTLPNTGVLGEINEVIKDDFPDLDIDVQSEAGTFPRITLKLTQDKIDFVRQNAVEQSLEIIRNRVDQFGVGDPVIVRQGEDEIVVQLPGIKDHERAKDLIKSTAQLEFKLVARHSVNLQELVDQAKAAGQWQEGGDAEQLKQLNLALQASLPKGTEIAFQLIEDEQNPKKENKKPVLLESPVLMTGDMVKDARVGYGGTFNEPLVSLSLTSDGGDIFADITEANVNRQLAIVLDGVVRSAPNITERILGGSAQISGSFTHTEASDLAIVLRVGALPAPVEIIQNMTVGASLGQDSINKGLMSGLFGALSVLIFMVIYYRLSGVIADMALALNILFVFAGLAMLGATLTLPGIAGIILSVGMAVDANVLIFERMREEFALGKSARSGVDTGFGKAFSSIVDSQVTTLITALALFLFGTGPIKGFAVTLSLGIIFNLFAVLFCTRLAYDWLFSSRKLHELKFMQFVRKPNFDFMSVKKIAFTASALLVIFGTVSFVEILLGQANLGVDFSGGSILQYKAEQPFQLDAIRSALKKGDFGSVDLQQVTGENRLIIKMKKTEDTVGHLGDEITAVLAEQPGKFTLESQSEIGSSVSNVLRNKAIEAIVISLIGVLLYLAIRFDFSFGLAAAAATFHDVLVALGICWIIDVEINLLLVTALLTLAGYSLNDSVVVFDRIRENMGRFHEKDFNEIINISINDTLGRSMVTSLTTSLVLIALFFFGGSAIHDFSFALLIGVIVGTYSSVFIASPLLTLKKR
jgi:SecD/SecF fusion protein